MCIRDRRDTQRDTQRDTERHRETQRDTERHRETQRDTERQVVKRFGKPQYNTFQIVFGYPNVLNCLVYDKAAEPPEAPARAFEGREAALRAEKIAASREAAKARRELKRQLKAEREEAEAAAEDLSLIHI